MAVHCESKPARRRPRIITRLSKRAPVMEKKLESVMTQPDRPLAEDARADNDRAGDNRARMTARVMG